MHARQSACRRLRPRLLPITANRERWGTRFRETGITHAVIPLTPQSQVDASQVCICASTKCFQTFRVIGGKFRKDNPVRQLFTALAGDPHVVCEPLAGTEIAQKKDEKCKCTVLIMLTEE
ncbi:hypothetical protein DMN91_008075 [Ooceraea biroi]|uniref:Uncharacterized protein n=1 Tax=Ooceraea biroi TaxID=2015173 RepID=A0A3L8DI59_OOCBI|nr:hypothetical protein DMN91_008075 [Ooceraea biroi]